MKNIVLTVLGLGLLLTVYLMGERTNKKIEEEGVECEFSSTVVSKWERRGIHFTLRNGPDISRYIMDSEMDLVMIGDSLIKRKGENTCVVLKSSGQRDTVRFQYLNYH